MHNIRPAGTAHIGGEDMVHHPVITADQQAADMVRVTVHIAQRLATVRAVPGLILLGFFANLNFILCFSLCHIYPPAACEVRRPVMLCKDLPPYNGRAMVLILRK